MSQLEGRTILVVEDDDMLRELIVRIFKNNKAKVFEASNGTEAFEIVKNNQIDAVVSDVRMPGGDGIELAHNIQSMTDPKPYIFICSGFNDLTREMISQLNIAQVFAKPFIGEELATAVGKSLND